jgi:hypothetical protein
MIGPTLGTILGPSQGAVAALGVMVVALLLIAFGLPESYKPKQGSTLTRGILAAPSGTAAAAAVLTPSPAAVATAAGRRRRPLDVFKSMGRSWVLINSSSLFRRLALCMAVVGVVSEVGHGLRHSLWPCCTASHGRQRHTWQPGDFGMLLTNAYPAQHKTRKACSRPNN